jgi:hypothetical protein
LGEAKRKKESGMTVTIEPLYTATVNGLPLRFFPSPLEGPDFPWHAFNDLMLCFAVTAEVKNVVMSKFVASEWRGHSRLVVDSAGEETIICPHYMAQGLLRATEQHEFVPKGARDAYDQVWTDALKKLTADLPIGSPEWLAWMKRAVSRGGDDNANPVLNPILAFIEAAEKYGSMVEDKDGKRVMQIAMPDEGADAAPPPSRWGSVGGFELELMFSTTRDALRRAEIADPAATKELALDLAEMAMLERGRKEGDPLHAREALIRAARGIVRLRRRFNPDVPGLANNPDYENQPLFVPHPDGLLADDGSPVQLVSEAGVWTLMLQWFEEGMTKSPKFTDFHKWLTDFRERALKA